MFGEYEFSLDFEPLGSMKAEFESLRNDVIVASGGHPVDSLLPVPHSPSVISGDVWLHRTLSLKWYTGVSLRDGQPVAVNKFAHDKTENAARRRLNFTTINMLSGGRGLVPIISLWCEHGHTPPCNTSETMYCSMPLSAYTFISMPWHRLDHFNTKLRFYYQTLEGLNELYSANLVYGRILPSDLWLLPDTSARELIDLAHKPVTWGPWLLPMTAKITRWYYGFPYGRRWKAQIPPCIAPEVRTSSAASSYIHKADIWSLGVSWMYSIYPKSSIDAITEASHIRSIVRKTSERYSGILGDFAKNILLPMLEMDPDARPEAQELLHHVFWKILEEGEAQAQAELGTGAGQPNTVKRKVRVQTLPTEEPSKRSRTRQPTPKKQS